MYLHLKASTVFGILNHPIFWRISLVSGVLEHPHQWTLFWVHLFNFLLLNFFFFFFLILKKKKIDQSRAATTRGARTTVMNFRREGFSQESFRKEGFMWFYYFIIFFLNFCVNSSRNPLTRMLLVFVWKSLRPTCISGESKSSSISMENKKRNSI